MNARQIKQVIVNAEFVFNFILEIIREALKDEIKEYTDMMAASILKQKTQDIDDKNKIKNEAIEWRWNFTKKYFNNFVAAYDGFFLTNKFEEKWSIENDQKLETILKNYYGGAYNDEIKNTFMALLKDDLKDELSRRMIYEVIEEELEKKYDMGCRAARIKINGFAGRCSNRLNERLNRIYDYVLARHPEARNLTRKQLFIIYMVERIPRDLPGENPRNHIRRIKNIYKRDRKLIDNPSGFVINKLVSQYDSFENVLNQMNLFIETYKYEENETIERYMNNTLMRILGETIKKHPKN